MKTIVSTLAVLVALSVAACSGGSSRRAPGEGLLVTAGDDCTPVAINNRSEIVLACRDEVIKIWSAESEVRELPPPPAVVSIFPENIPLVFHVKGFSDDGKVLFSLEAPLDFPSIEEIPAKSYLFEGTNYRELDGFYSAISDDGRFLAGIGSDGFAPTLLHDFEPVELAPLPNGTSLIEVSAVNSAGLAVGAVRATDTRHSFFNTYASFFSASRAEIVPPAIRPDKYASRAIDVNHQGSILVATLTEVEPSGPDSVRDINRAGLVSEQNGLQDIGPADPLSDVIPLAMNDSGVVLAIVVNAQDAAASYQLFSEKSGITPVAGLIPVPQGINVGDIALLNDRNQIVIEVLSGVSTEYRLYGLPADFS